jgi:hypothetical protein
MSTDFPNQTESFELASDEERLLDAMLDTPSIGGVGKIGCL